MTQFASPVPAVMTDPSPNLLEAQGERGSQSVKERETEWGVNLKQGVVVVVVGVSKSVNALKCTHIHIPTLYVECAPLTAIFNTGTFSHAI